MGTVLVFYGTVYIVSMICFFKVQVLTFVGSVSVFQCFSPAGYEGEG